jgi:hypothetical protein
LLLSEWAEHELGEIRHAVWYREESAGFHLLSTDRPVSTADEERINRTGWAVLSLRTKHQWALRHQYLNGQPLRYRERVDALDAFGRMWDSWLEFTQPTNAR